MSLIWTTYSNWRYIIHGIIGTLYPPLKTIKRKTELRRKLEMPKTTGRCQNSPVVFWGYHKPADYA